MIRRIAILGFGKMGSWLARELAKDRDKEVAAYDINAGNKIAIQKIATQAKNVMDIRQLNDVSQLAQFKPELLINAVSLQNTIPAFENAVKHLPKDCMIADVASVKAGLAEFYRSCGFRFVSMHPMFGPVFANMESLKEENVVLIKESDSSGKEFFRDFFANLGLRIFEYSFEEHDRMMAYSLTTPFAASLVFAACMEKNTVPGTTFARHRKIAKGLLSEDDHLLAEILFNPNSAAQIEKITAKLEFLKHIIRGRDYEEAKKFFNKLRKNLGE